MSVEMSEWDYEIVNGYLPMSTKEDEEQLDQSLRSINLNHWASEINFPKKA